MNADKLKNIEFDDTFIVMDFDRTLTSGDSYYTWDVISKDPLLPQAYTEEIINCSLKYENIEHDLELNLEYRKEMMIKWWLEHFRLLQKYHISKKLIDNLSGYHNLTLRSGALDFLSLMHLKKVPVIIISAGIGNIIERFLKLNNCNYDNIYIISNFLKYDRGYVIGHVGELVYSLNKNEVYLSDRLVKNILGRKKAILFGDNIADIDMLENFDYEEAITVGFVNNSSLKYQAAFKVYNIICNDGLAFNRCLELWER